MRPIPALLLLGMLSLLAACDTEAERAGAPAGSVKPAAVATLEQSTAMLTRYVGAPAATQHARCSIDIVNGRPTSHVDTDPESGAIFEGWATDATGAAAGGLRVVLVGAESYMVEGTTGLKRPDVAAAIGDAAETSGFRVAVPVLGVPKGDYSARIEAIDGSFSCPTRLRLVVN